MKNVKTRPHPRVILSFLACHFKLLLLYVVPENTDIDEMMYRLFVIDKVRKGREAIKKGETMTLEALRKEIETWK